MMGASRIYSAAAPEQYRVVRYPRRRQTTARYESAAAHYRTFPSTITRVERSRRIFLIKCTHRFDEGYPGTDCSERRKARQCRGDPVQKHPDKSYPRRYLARLDGRHFFHASFQVVMTLSRLAGVLVAMGTMVLMVRRALRWRLACGFSRRRRTQFCHHRFHTPPLLLVPLLVLLQSPLLLFLLYRYGHRIAFFFSHSFIILDRQFMVVACVGTAVSISSPKVQNLLLLCTHHEGFSDESVSWCLQTISASCFLIGTGASET